MCSLQCFGVRWIKPQLRARIPVELDQAPLVEARTNLRAALAAYMGSCRAYDRKYVDLWHELSSLEASGGLPADMAAQHVFGGTVSSGGIDYRKSRAQSTLATAAYDAFRELYPREGFDLGRPQD